MIYTKNWNYNPKYMVFYTKKIDAKMRAQYRMAYVISVKSRPYRIIVMNQI
jgi:hypothetical protein